MRHELTRSRAMTRVNSNTGFLVLAVSLLACQGAAEGAGTTYYFSSSVGDDSWSGLAAVWDGTDGPKRTLDALKEHLAMGQEGDRFLLRCGDSWTADLTGKWRYMGLRGVNENYPIVIGSYGGGEKPRIYVTSEDGRGDLVIVGNDVASNYVFENLHVVGSDFGAAFFLSIC